MAPLQYRKHVTRRKLHAVFLSSWFVFGFISVTVTFGVFHRDFDRQLDCIPVHILQTPAYYVMPVAQFVLATGVLFVNYVALRITLKQREKQRRKLTLVKADERWSSLSAKLTRVSVITLSTYLVLYIPALLVSSLLLAFPNLPRTHMIALLDASILLYFCNNVVNPFIYGCTLRTFRRKFTHYLTCGRSSSTLRPDTSTASGSGIRSISRPHHTHM